MTFFGIGLIQLLPAIVSGLFSLAYDIVCGHPLYVLKTHDQMSDEFLGLRDLVDKLMKEKGLIGFWNGYLPWGILISLTTGISFQIGKQLVLQTYSLFFRGTPNSILTAACAGFFESLFVSPLVLLKNRAITKNILSCQTNNYARVSKKADAVIISPQSSLSFVTKICHLFKGSDIFVIKRTMDWFLRHLFIDFCFKYVSNNLLINSLIGCTGCVYLTMFFDYSQTVIQSEQYKFDDSISLITIVKTHFNDKSFHDVMTKGLKYKILNTALSTIVFKDIIPVIVKFVQTQNSKHELKFDL
ncbi:hypothetical protein RFI_04821 [Reticulomyxa filosa]|uniref:Mitochondrial carrier protein n=1 Tax=Reticulomyxa filosa TaxID=46433 RepID=X6P2D2_RETFI|nr:hypothetical protein RFI_04821 [Reticulomyxa filosa]|eukprot:ETO32298.1 hypothetical protein RFI_04821 [Reticulomyxa filosa]